MKDGRIVVDAERRTSLEGVWAGGDCVLGGEDLTVSAVEDGKSYRVAGWASVNPQAGKRVTDVVADYLRHQKTVKIKRLNNVTLKGIANNPGIIGGG